MSTKTNHITGTMLDLVVDCFTPEVARRLTSLQLTPAMQARIDELADKANEGALSPEEQAEYRAVIKETDLIGILQAKARRFLSRQAS